MGSARYRTSGRTGARRAAPRAPRAAPAGRGPGKRAAGAPRFLHSMAWMVEAAGLSSAGLSGAVRTEGLALVYLNALRVWLADDTEDMAKTMAALDWGLRQAEMLMHLCGFGAPPGTGEDTPAAG